MKVKTKKQRAEFYRVAAEIMATETRNDIYKILRRINGSDIDINFLDSTFCCDILAGLSKMITYELLDEKTFPEIFLFKPTPEEQGGNTGWWDYGDIDVRTIAFLLAGEMCEN